MCIAFEASESKIEEYLRKMFKNIERLKNAESRVCVVSSWQSWSFRNACLDSSWFFSPGKHYRSGKKYSNINANIRALSFRPDFSSSVKWKEGRGAKRSSIFAGSSAALKVAREHNQSCRKTRAVKRKLVYLEGRRAMKKKKNSGGFRVFISISVGQV